MGPKKGKDTTTDENYWRTSIEDAFLDEESWKVKVIIIEAAGSDQDRIYLNKFEIFAAEEKRFIIKNICKTETIFMINQLGGEKKVKDDNLRVFEEGQAYLKDKKDIPPDIIALVIKYLILKMKEESLFIKKQRLEVREGIRRESTTMIDETEVRGTVGVKIIETTEPSPPPKVKSKRGEPEAPPQTPELPEGKKYNTLLRVRGEEWRDKVYVDDFPQDGPNLYVAVTGFVEPLLAECLVKIGIPLTAIVQVRIDCTVTKVPSSLLRPSKRGQSQTEILTEKSTKFWENLQQLRIHRDTADSFKSTAFIVFSPPYSDDNLTGQPDKIYDELCYLMYDIQDLTRQHSHYLENMDIINVPQDNDENISYKYYHQQIQDLPLECVTIYSILDYILQTVTSYQRANEKSSKTSLSTALTINKQPKPNEEKEKVARTEKLVKDIFSSLCKTDQHKMSYRVTYGEEYEHHKDPIVIEYGDIAKYTTFHLGNINLDNIVWTTLLGMPFNSLWKNQNRIEGELEAKINFHVNVLLSCFKREDVEITELNRLIHILACRKLYNNRSSLKKRHQQPSTISEFKKVYLKRSILAEPLTRCPSLIKTSNSITQSFSTITKSDNLSNASYGDDLETSRIKFLFDCPDISELVSAAEIANGQPIGHMIDDYEHFEDFSGVSAFQILLDAFNRFNCLDYKFCEVTDCFILMFFNSHDKDGITREQWHSHIATPLCLQDFFDFVLDEHYDWIQNEEKIYNENCLGSAQSECKEASNPFAGASCVKNMNIDLELLIEDSLKFQEFINVKDEGPETIDTITTTKKTTISPTSIGESKGSRKPKSSSASTPKQLRQSFIAPGTGSDTSINIPRKPFIGYNLGNRRVEVFGQNSTYFSNDGTRVTTKYTLTIPNNLEYIILNIVPGNNINEFWLHKALGEYVTSDITDICESFRITSRDKMLINIKKQNYLAPVPFMPSYTENHKIKDNFKSTAEEVNDEIFENKYFHSLVITWPNGLITETVHLDNSSNISHIKQFYINPLRHLDEEIRCVSLNGEVVIFRPSGIIEVLQPDGSFIKINKCEKRIIQKGPFEKIHSETSSEKSKKGKGKEQDKNKDNTNKGSSKSSKNINDDTSDVKPVEYELFIDEFETIDSNGLRQKWKNEKLPYFIEKLLIRTATDYCQQEVFSRRIDGTNILLNKDGIQVVTFPNNTRIITKYVVDTEEVYPEWTDEEKQYLDMLDSDTIETDTIKSKVSFSQKSYVGGSYPHSTSVASTYVQRLEEEQFKDIERTDGYVSIQIIFIIEHENFTTVTVEKSTGNITLDSPNKTKVVIDTSNNYTITLDDTTTATFDGQTLNIDYEACAECNSITTCSVKVTTDNTSSATKMQQNWLKMKDSFCKKVVVNEEGHIYIYEEPCSTEIHHTDNLSNLVEYNEVYVEKRHDTKSETSMLSHGKCREMYWAKNFRFFTLNRELSCSELIHRAILNQYKRSCRWQSWCSINQYDTFGDHRSLLSILTPIHLTESEKWLMDSKLADKPKFLTYKDLKKDTGKGFYHWMRPYERFQPKPKKSDNVLLPRLPRAFILRTLEQQWKETERQNLKGAAELLAAILRYRHVMESDSETLLHVPIKDNRSDNEKCTDDIIQVLGHRIYEDLKTRLADDVETRAKATITTKPLPVSAEVSIEGELEEEESCKPRRLDEERGSIVKEVEAAQDMSPNLMRYWRRRAEENKEEQFYKYLLREGSVPPYFRNVLGGAIWWEMNNAAGNAASLAERKKMKCVCAEEGTPSTNDTVLPFM